MNIEEQFNKITLFLEKGKYHKELIKAHNKGQKSININFSDLIKYNPELGEQLLDKPDSIIRVFNQVVDDTFKEGYATNKLFEEKDKKGGSSVLLVLLEQVEQVERLEQVEQKIVFPSYISTNSLRVLYLLFLVKIATRVELAKFLKLEKNSIYKIFTDTKRQSGLVERATVLQVEPIDLPKNVLLDEKFFKISREGIAYLMNLEKSYFDKLKRAKERQKTVELLHGEGDFCVRFFNLPSSCRVEIDNIRTKYLNKFVVIEGVVRRKSDVRPQVTNARFECPSCGNILSVIQLDKKFKEPTRCSCGRRGKFRLIGKHLKDSQVMVVENLGLMTDFIDIRRLNVFVNDDLCDYQQNMLIGNRILMTGIIKEFPLEIGRVQMTRYDLYLDANHIQNLEDKTIELTKQDEKKILGFAKKNGTGVLSALAKLLSPEIVGNNHIKKACLLQLVSSEDHLFKRRLGINTYLYGGLGLGKTVLAQASRKLAHKSIYVDATKSSEVGLTGAVVKDDFLKTWVLDAGAIALAGDGLAVIDELDKREEKDKAGLAEPLEERKITVSKANIHQTIPAPARILSCGNLATDYVPGNLINPQALLLKPHVVDRYDLFLKAENIEDSVLADKILDEKGEFSEDVFLKKYISYSKKYKPDTYVLPKDVKAKLNDFFVNVRAKQTYFEFMFSPARFLWSLRRFVIASAKLRLVKKPELCDVEIVTNLFRRALTDMGFDLEVVKEDDINDALAKPKRESGWSLKAVKFVKDYKNEHKKPMPIDEFLKEYSEEEMGLLLKKASLFELPNGYLNAI